MIPSMANSAAVPIATGKLLFHVIVDDFNGTFSMDGPDGLNGIRLHHEMMQALRSQKRKLPEFDLRAESQDAALADMREYFPGYVFLGSWADVQANKTAAAGTSKQQGSPISGAKLI
jgi:hypothetical protein